MPKLFRLSFAIALICQSAVQAQTTFPVNGAPDPQHTVYAFRNCTLHVDAETVIPNGVLLVKDGRIVLAAAKGDIPKEAVALDLKGKHIYPAFIDLYSDYGMPEIKWGAQPDGSKKGAYGWNQAIKSDAEAHKIFLHNSQKADELRKLGFGAVLSHQKDGIVRGSGTLVNLCQKKENESIVSDRAAAFYSFNKGSSTQQYPSSLMGAIALLRQTYYDAQWYKANGGKTEYNISLEAFNRLQELPAIFEGNDKYNDLRAKTVADEFKTKYIIKGGGNEYQRLNEIQSTYARYIIPLNFPDAMDVEDPFDAEQVSLADLKHWEMAPANLAMLEKNRIDFCITTADLKFRNEFLRNLRKAVKYGLSEKMALKALTSNPAAFINAQDKLGSLKQGFYANFFIASKSVFDDECVIYETWSNGLRYAYEDLNAPQVEGNYRLTVGAASYNLLLSKDKPNNVTVTMADSVRTKGSYTLVNNLLTLNYPYDSISTVRLSGNYNEAGRYFTGRAQYPDGNWADFRMVYLNAGDTTAKKSEPTKQPEYGKVFYPFMAYGEPLPESEGFVSDNWKKFKTRYNAVLIKDATVWTNEADSVLPEYDVYITDGKIVRIAPNIDAPVTAYAKIINGKGMHLTPGIIDEHSHIALFSVNEGAPASSAEVRMGDVVNVEDINIYRQLAGGVTTAQLLHGSANPIGGQSCLIKLRWGKGPEEFKYERAAPFIKFALGENVKHSNGINPDLQRFPQTRMGVEQCYYDYFTRAAAYKKAMNDAANSSLKVKPVAPRRDLGLDALVEILDNKRFITCHSYVQSELNMLMHVADSMKFKINTFTHILEGYKMADKMKEHGINASTFADWWAYKLEVMDAIPYNAALMTNVGINTAINSDDAEMGRRLNQEAAKAVKYGGLSEVQALKLVTLNPAKMLHIDDKVGSIKVGKVADLVLWTDHPLSVYAKADKTLIDGQVYFDAENDAKLRDDIRRERARIIGKLILEKNKGTRVIKPQARKPKHFHCDTEDSGLEYMGH